MGRVVPPSGCREESSAVGRAQLCRGSLGGPGWRRVERSWSVAKSDKCAAISVQNCPQHRRSASAFAQEAHEQILSVGPIRRKRKCVWP